MQTRLTPTPTAAPLPSRDWKNDPKVQEARRRATVGTIHDLCVDSQYVADCTFLRRIDAYGEVVACAAVAQTGTPSREELAKIVYAADGHPPNMAFMTRAYDRCAKCEATVNAILARWPALGGGTPAPGAGEPTREATIRAIAVALTKAGYDAPLEYVAIALSTVAFPAGTPAPEPRSRVTGRGMGTEVVTLRPDWKPDAWTDAKHSGAAAPVPEPELDDAINWLMGCAEHGFSPPPDAQFPDAPYWWRTEFARRAGLIYNPAKQRYVLHPPAVSPKEKNDA